MSKRINLSSVEVLILGEPAFDVLGQVLQGFGFRRIHRCAQPSEARELCKRQAWDLILCDGDVHDGQSYAFVSWLRRAKLDPNSYTPVIMLTAHTPSSKVRIARDCGANFLISKPIVPAVLLDRIIWVAQDQRPFLEASGYVGPDRRARDEGPPAGLGERRADRSGAFIDEPRDREEESGPWW
jgi:CheY-like chemotaxis protein